MSDEKEKVGEGEDGKVKGRGRKAQGKRKMVRKDIECGGER